MKEEYGEMRSKAIEYAYIKLIKSGVGFEDIPKEKIIMTCKEYDGIISKRNHEAVLNAINSIYEKV